MGFRFRKSIKILPGVRVNLSRSGISTSLGVPGATVNLGRRGARGTAGLPGTGLSYSERLHTPPSLGSGSVGTGVIVLLALLLAVIAWVVG